MDVSEERISQAQDALVTTRQSAKGFMALLFSGTVFLAGCVHWPDIATECEAYGVTEADEPMGSIVVVEPLFRDQLDMQCADVKEATARINPDAQISGCVIPEHGGVAKAYYWKGDRCALNHELCHAKHGPGHTERYLSDLERGVPMPYCPENQLWPRS